MNALTRKYLLITYFFYKSFSEEPVQTFYNYDVSYITKQQAVQQNASKGLECMARGNKQSRNHRGRNICFKT